MTEIHEKIRLLRHMNKLNQEEMANLLDMSTNGYAKIERGESALTIERLQQIAQKFDITLVDLLLLGDKNLFVFGDNNTNNLSHHNNLKHRNKKAKYIEYSQKNYYSDSQEMQQLQHELEKAQLNLQHKDDVIARLEQENQLLKQLVNSLQKS